MRQRRKTRGAILSRRRRGWRRARAERIRNHASRRRRGGDGRGAKSRGGGGISFRRRRRPGFRRGRLQPRRVSRTRRGRAAGRGKGGRAVLPGALPRRVQGAPRVGIPGDGVWAVSSRRGSLRRGARGERGGRNRTSGTHREGRRGRHIRDGVRVRARGGDRPSTRGRRRVDERRRRRRRATSNRRRDARRVGRDGREQPRAPPPRSTPRDPRRDRRRVRTSFAGMPSRRRRRHARSSLAPPRWAIRARRCA